jgi:CheY-like chemotaxis protein
VLCRILESLGIAVDQASDGAEAVRKVKEGAVALAAAQQEEQLGKSDSSSLSDTSVSSLAACSSSHSAASSSFSSVSVSGWHAGLTRSLYAAIFMDTKVCCIPFSAPLSSLFFFLLSLSCFFHLMLCFFCLESIFYFCCAFPPVTSFCRFCLSCLLVGSILPLCSQMPVMNGYGRSVSPASHLFTAAKQCTTEQRRAESNREYLTIPARFFL